MAVFGHHVILDWLILLGVVVHAGTASLQTWLTQK